MKSSTSTLLRLLTFNSIAVLMSVSASACGPYYPIIPTPDFFADSSYDNDRKRFEKNENLRLWQELTSKEIPLSDIEQAVYVDDEQTFRKYTSYDHPSTDNKFYIHLNNTRDEEIIDFLSIAKLISEQRALSVSPWYYPESRQEDYSNFSNLLEYCKNSGSTRLADRYALQAIRCLFSTRKYAECIEYYDEAFADFPDSNLFKRMATGYVAGCWARLGETEKANEYFAIADDIYSLGGVDIIEWMSEKKPDSPMLMAHIRSMAGDSARICGLRPVAEKILSTKNPANRGDWEFLLAYIDGHFQKNYKSARKHIDRALSAPFSSDNFRDHARAFRMQINAELNNRSTLLADLKWFETKINILSPDVNEWNRILQNIVFAHWVPVLWSKGDYTSAILLCGYADNLLDSKIMHFEYHNDGPYIHPFPSKSVTLEDIRHRSDLYNDYDYSNLSFLLMGSLKSEQLIKVKNSIGAANPLYSFLRRYARTDSDYFNELIGTLALREENYARAVQYLQQVSLDYQKNMNIYSCGYLARDPFVDYPTRCVSEFDMECSVGSVKIQPEDAKLKFARTMLSLKKDMQYGANADIRGLARLRYAMGLRNSFEQCWALTQYWRGMVCNRFIPILDYWDSDECRLDFLYNYDNQKFIEENYKTEVSQALASLVSDAAKAEAHYLLGNVKTVIKHFPDTPTAEYVRTHCDNWHDWL